MRNIVGVDIGGTKVAAGIVDASGNIGYRTRAAMTASGSAEQGFSAVRTAIDDVLRRARQDGIGISGIGVCSPGPLDPRSGIVVNPPNLPCWRNFHLAEAIEQSFAMRARVDNDANAAALAETLWGAAAGYEYVFYATLGTGIGTGIVLHKQIYYGRTGGAAEGGHMSIDYRGPACACGKRGCIEILCSGPAIARRAGERIRERAYTGLLTQNARDPHAISAEDLGRAHAQGDPLAAEVLGETAELLAVWLGNIIDLLEPEVIVLGGGVSELMEPWVGAIAQQVCRWSVNSRACEIPIVRAKYGAESGIAGAAALALCDGP